jgi:hypothetical protein
MQFFRCPDFANNAPRDRRRSNVALRDAHNLSNKDIRLKFNSFFSQPRKRKNRAPGRRKIMHGRALEISGGLNVYFRNLEKLIKIDRQRDPQYVAIPREVFRSLLAGAIKNKNLFDERFYLETYPDIATAVRAKKVKSGLDHYVETGYFENRLPRRFIVDERYYLQANPDVAEAIKKGRLKSAQDHFNHAGFTEGRVPYKDFSIF